MAEIAGEYEPYDSRIRSVIIFLQQPSDTGQMRLYRL